MGRGVQRLGSNLGQTAGQFGAKGKQGRTQAKVTDVVHGTSKTRQAKVMSKLTDVTQFKG